MIVSRNAIFLEKYFIQDGGSGRLVELEEKIFEEQRVIDPQKSIIHEPVFNIFLPPRRSSKIFRPPERYMDMLTEKVKKMFLMEDKCHGDDPNTFDKAMSDIDSKK